MSSLAHSMPVPGRIVKDNPAKLFEKRKSKGISGRKTLLKRRLSASGNAVRELFEIDWISVFFPEKTGNMFCTPSQQAQQCGRSVVPSVCFFEKKQHLLLKSRLRKVY